MSGWEIVTAISVSTDSSTPKTVSISCPGTKKVIGGGGNISSGDEADVVVVQSYPSANNTWFVRGDETFNYNSSWSVTVYAICATVN